MSDFLSRLVDRNHDITSKVRPRPRSRFESGSDSEPQAIDSAEPSDAIEKELQAAMQLPPEQTAIPSGSNQLRQAHISPEHNLGQQTASPIDTRAIEPATSPASNQLQPDKLSKDDEVADFGTRNSAKLQPRSVLAQDKATSGPQPKQHIATRREPRPIEPVSAALTSERDASANQAPVVRVTIGRVEIRAVQPKAPQQHPRASTPRPRPGPKLSLDAYLQSRRGKGP